MTNGISQGKCVIEPRRIVEIQRTRRSVVPVVGFEEGEHIGNLEMVSVAQGLIEKEHGELTVKTTSPRNST